MSLLAGFCGWTSSLIAGRNRRGMLSMARFDGPSKFIRVMFSNAAAGAGETIGGFYMISLNKKKPCQCLWKSVTVVK